MAEVIGLVRRMQNTCSNGSGLDDRWDFNLELSPWSLDDGPFRRTTFSILKERLVPDVALSLAHRIQRNSVVALSVELVEDDPNQLSGGLVELVATDPSEDERIHALVTAASPARFAADTVTEADGTEFVVPDIWRRDPVDLPDIGPAWPRYRLNRRLSLPTFDITDYESDPLEQRVFDGGPFSFLVSDVQSSDLPLAARAIRAFIDGGAEIRHAATPHVLTYAREFWNEYGRHEGAAVPPTASDLWSKVMFHHRNANLVVKEHIAYVIIEANCEWEPEHGLQLVFRRGDTICKVSEYDGRPPKSGEPIYQPRFS